MSRVRRDQLEAVLRAVRSIADEVNRMSGGHRIIVVESDYSVHTTLAVTPFRLMDSFPKAERRFREIEQALESLRRDVEFLMATADGFDDPGDDQ